MRLAVATIVALFAFVSPALASQVTVHSVDNTSPSGAAGARTVYAVEFTATNGVANGQRITLAFPLGTAFTGGVGSDVLVGTTDVGYCTSPSQLTIECFLNTGASIAPGTRVRVVLGGVTNTSAGARQLLVSTTNDADAVAGGFTVVTPGTISAVTLTNANPSNAAGARTVYELEFTTSPTGALAYAANSRITLALPAGTTFTGGVTSNVHVGATDVGFCYSPVGTTIECALNTNATIAAGARVRITLAGVTNPTATGPHLATVSTTSDPGPINSSAINVVADGDVSAVTFTNPGPSAAAGARTVYELEFTTSPTGALAYAANSRITLALPAGTTFTGGVTSNVHVGATDVGFCYSPVGTTIECALNTNATIAAGARVRITLAGVTNPTATGPHLATVSTTSDPGPINSSAINVVADGDVSAVTFTNPGPSAAAGARTVYELEFTTSPTGALAYAANSRITLALPAGTTFTGGVTSNVHVGATDVGFCYSPVGTTIECALNTNATIAAGARVRITLAGVTNPTATGPHLATVSTTSDPGPINSSAINVVAANTVSAVTVGVANPVASATTQYAVGFTASATGGLSYAANSHISVVFATGTTFPSGFTSNVLVGTTDVGFCFSPTNLTIDCALNTNAVIAPGSRVLLTFDGVGNPSTTGTHAVRVATTSDVAQVASNFQIGEDTVPPETTVGSSPFTFASNEPGSTFECAIDGGEFTACTSPFTPPAGLAPGEHTLSVRAIDAAGNPDPTPASSRFAVEQPPPASTPIPTVAPTPTATPTPEPTPQFNQTVVAKPAGGTVEVCPKGGKCFTLQAGQPIPMGSTVNTKKGAVELTSISAPGAPPQKAVFSEGIFRISQRGNITELKLTEPLAPCSKRARAAAKKPKSRKLWGKGSGKFRTVGNYSAATIRGTEWLTQDSCSGTLTRVTEGVVTVRAGRKTVIVRAGKKYLAKPPR